jgi:hypothetical protein
LLQQHLPAFPASAFTAHSSGRLLASAQFPRVDLQDSRQPFGVVLNLPVVLQRSGQVRHGFIG